MFKLKTTLGTNNICGPNLIRIRHEKGLSQRQLAKNLQIAGSDNISILGLQEYAEHTSKKHIITTAIEHKAVLEPLSALEAKGFEVTYIKPDKSGRINPDEVLSNVRDDTLLVSVMHTNNETGVIQPVDVIGEALDNTDIFFHVDAAQSFGKLVDELKSVKYSFLSASAHKMYGPQGIGTLILRKKKFKSPPVKSELVFIAKK